MKVKLKEKIIREYIMRNNTSVGNLAHKLNYESSQLSHWLSGKKPIGNIARKKIQKLLKKKWDELFEIMESEE